ncbi:5' nucleotidase, NT5C type (plasmid) [Halorientalis pallida]|uniref:5' nucleotidase, NT5C type n=1 Tax=Halorientalis pallida TaxID=2479928 RepID=UPI003C6EEDED
MRIAVDVDGVLADHVSAVLSQLRAEHDEFAKVKSEMTHWDEPLPELDTSLKPAIEAAESEPAFIRNMPPVEGAIEWTTELADRGHELIIVTARPEAILPATHEWLEANDIPNRREESLSTRGEMKTIADAEILIDDFPGHIRDFAAAGKEAILFVQPWNKSEVDELTESPRIFAAEDWEQVPTIVESLYEASEREGPRDA